MSLDARDAARSYADGAAVTTWTGRPGTSINAAGTVPKMDVDGLNGLPAVDFPGATGSMTHTAEVTGSATWICAMKATATYSGYRGIAAAGANTSAGSMLLANTGSGRWGTYTTTGDGAATTGLANGAVAILSMIDNAASGGEFWRNGATNGTYAGNSAGQPERHLGGVDFLDQLPAMKLGAICLFYSAIVSPLRRRIEQSLAFSFRIPCE
jgi:hypothetical protein